MLISLQKDKSHRILLIVTFVLVAIMGVMIFAVPPGIDPDPCWGFLAMHSMEQGHSFNLIVSPDTHNIAKDHTEFLAWWSPGQYMVPYFFKVLLNVSTGRAVSLTIALCNLLGLCGFYKLFKQLGFTKWVAAISIAFIVSQQFFLVPFVYYTGGEVLLFAFIGWFLYGCFSFSKISWQALVFVFFAGLLGFFSKSSVLWMYVAGLACMWINISVNETNYLRYPGDKPEYTKKTIGNWATNGVRLAIPFLAASVIIYISYLSKGANPSASEGRLLVRPETFGFPLASPILSGFSVDEMVNGLIYHPDGQPIPYNSALTAIFIMAFCSISFMVVIAMLAPDRKYLLAMLVFYIAGTIFFTDMYLKQASISYEGRHFRIIGLLAIPGFIYLLLKTKVTGAVFFVIWIAFIHNGFNFFEGEYRDDVHAPKGNSGFGQQVYDEATINEIVKIDRAYHNDAIFVVTGSDLAIEVSNNRVIILDNDMPADGFSKLKYEGRAGPLYIVVPKEYSEDDRKSNLIKCFTGYHKFTFKHLSDSYDMCFATE